MKLEKFERYPLMSGPTPLEPLKRLTERLGGAEIWAKRDDCDSGLAFGGNKIRKLEYLIPDALAKGCDALVTIGGIQSNHTRQVAAVAAKVGLKCHLIQMEWSPFHDITYDRVGNILLSRMMGAEIHIDPAGSAGAMAGLNATWQWTLDHLDAFGKKPYPIPAGASDHPLGGLGYAGFAVEVARQEKEHGVFFDYVVVCAVTGSTFAGMIVGFAAQGRPRKVIGIDASAEPAQTRALVLRIARDTAQRVELGREITERDVLLEEGFAGPAYGVPTDQTIRAIELVARTEGMLTDPVYEGKSMAGLVELVQSRKIPADSKVLYVHLGGAPALSAYASLFR